MTTLAQLRQQLADIGYIIYVSAEPGLPVITAHFHPLINQPVVLVGMNEDGARDYQVTLIENAVKRR
jgi:hypothetical protein